jgi:hypothetical protein
MWLSHSMRSMRETNQNGSQAAPDLVGEPGYLAILFSRLDIGFIVFERHSVPIQAREYFYPSRAKLSVEAAILYSSGLRNSSPKSRISPTESCRSTLAVMGGVSLGTTPEGAEEGAGMVR